MGEALVAYDGDGEGRQENATQRRRREQWQKIQDAAQPIVDKLAELAGKQVQLRKPIEDRWLEDLRQYHGIYEKQTELELKADDDRSRTFINITRTKTNAWSARLGDMLLPNDEKNWGINPTPLPTLTGQAREITVELEKLHQEAEDAAEQHNQAVASGAAPEGPSVPLAVAKRAASAVQAMKEREAQIQREIEEANKRCSAMERLIDDQLTEARFPAKCRDTLSDMCKLGVGVMKGPFVSGRARKEWVASEDGEYSLAARDDNAPGYRRVNPWHFFPDMEASDIDESEFTFERYLPNPKMLRKMARDLRFNPDAVRKLLREGPDGHGGENTDLSYMAELRNMEGTEGASDASMGPLRGRFIVWEYRGTVDVCDIAAMIRASGRMDDANRFEEEADPLDERMVTVWFCNGRLLKIEEDYLLDSGASIYSVASFEKSEASILGAVGVPRLMKHEQAMLNSAVRMVMDNAALAVSPQVVVDQTAVEPVNGSWKLTARKVWRRIKTAVTGTGPEYKPFELFPIPLNQAQLAAIIEMAIKFIDEAVAMPLIAQGEQGAHITDTAQGMTMLMNSANVVFRRVVKNYDDDMIGIIHRSYDYNMQFSDRPEVKGDMKVEARGTSVLLVREVQSMQLMGILREWSTHPLMGVGFRAYQAMRMVLQAMSINPDDLLIAEDEYLEKLKAMAAPKDEAETPEQIRAQASLEVARIDAESREKDGQVQLQVADMRRQTEFAKLAQNRDISLANIEAMFKSKIGTEQIKAHSAERKLAVEVAVERQNAERARADGMQPTGSGGTVSFGEKADAA